MVNSAKVLVLGDDTRSFLTIVRSLGRQNIEVHVGFCAKHRIALKSKYISRVHFEIENDQILVVDALVRLLEIEKYDLVIPCTDAINAQLQFHRERFSTFPELPLMSTECYKITSSKYLTMKVAEEFEIHVPRYTIVTKGRMPTRFQTGYAFPVVLKPISSVAMDNPTVRLNVVKAHNYKELCEKLERVIHVTDVVIQENFIGSGVGVECLAKDGKLLTVFQHERVHEPIHGGGSSYRKSVPVHPELLAASIKFISRLNYTGVIMFEYKMNHNTGEWIIIEINARFWGSLPLAVSAGIDFPYYLYLMHSKGRTDFKKDYRTGIYCRNIYSDAWWFVANLKADKNDPRLATKPIRKVLMEICNCLIWREHFDTFTFDDLRPGFADLGLLMSSVLSKGLTKAYRLLLPNPSKR